MTAGVYSADGRLVFEAATITRQNPYRFSLSGIAMLNLYKKQTDDKLFSKNLFIDKSNMSMCQPLTRFLALTVVLALTGQAVYGQATMPRAPLGAYTRFFKYYRPGATDMPAGADHTSNAIIGIYQFRQVGRQRYSEAGTGFLIYTKRNDHKICMCTVGHNLTDGFHANVGDVTTLDAYMKYRGKPSDQNPLLNEPVSGYKTVIHPEVVEKMYDDPADGADAALLLVDEGELPLTTLSMLGCSEQDVYNSTSSFYLISHPNRMAQRIADSLVFVPAPPVGTLSSVEFLFSGTGNNCISDGSSGAPVIYKGGQGSFVTGIFGWSETLYRPYVPAVELIPGDGEMQYVRNYLGATKIAALMPAIRKHCWQQDSAGIAASHSYKQGITLDNSAETAQFLINRSIASQAGIAVVAEPGFNIGCSGCILLKGNLLTINCSLTPDDSLSRFFGLGKEVRLDAGFSYTASGNYYMEMNTVVPEQAAASTARKAGGGPPRPNEQPGEHMDTTAGFLVYPNPSNNGIFYLSFPKNDDDYSLKVYSSDGRLVYEAATIAGQNPYRFSLAGMARGTYVLALYKKLTGKKLFSKTIIYQ